MCEHELLFCCSWKQFFFFKLRTTALSLLLLMMMMMLMFDAMSVYNSSFSLYFCIHYVIVTSACCVLHTGPVLIVL